MKTIKTNKKPTISKSRKRKMKTKQWIAWILISLFILSPILSLLTAYAETPNIGETLEGELSELESQLRMVDDGSPQGGGIAGGTTTPAPTDEKKLDVTSTLAELTTLTEDSRKRLDNSTSLSPSSAVQLNLDRMIIQDLLQKLDKEEARLKKTGSEVNYKIESAYIKGKEILKECNDKDFAKSYNKILEEFDILADGTKHKADFQTLTENTEVSKGLSVKAVKELETDMISIIDLTKATGGADTKGATEENINTIIADPETVTDFIKKYKDDMVNILNITAPKYSKWMEGNGHDMTAFKDEVNRWGTLLSELATAMGIVIDFSGDSFKDSNVGTAIDINSDLTPLLIEDGGKLTAIGAELVGWSACLTPFQTNVNDYMNRESLSEQAKEVFDMYSKHRTPVYAIIDNKNIIQGIRTGASYELGNITLRDLLEKVDKGDLVFYMSKLGEKEVNDLKLESVKSTATPTFVNTDENFIGPVYYASGNQNIDFSKDLKNKQILEVAKENPLVGKMARSDLYMNYVTLHNHIEEGRQYMSSIQEDMDKAIYFDFMGNVVTEGGYVIISAASNPVMYTEKGAPVMTASWINGYPRTQVQGDSRVRLTEGDIGKFAVGMKEGILKTQYYAVQLNSKGNAFKEKLAIAEPFSLASKKDDNAIEFMPAEGYTTIGKSYAVSNTLKIFTNTSAAVTYYDGDKVRKVNLSSISTQGGDSTWDFIIKQIGIMLEDRENYNTSLLSEITNVIPKTSQSGQLMLISEVISRAGGNNFNAVNNFFGALLEGLINNIMNKVAQNGTFYNPMESASEIGLEVKLVPLLVILMVLVMLILLLKTILGIFRQDYIGTDILKAVVTLTLAALFILYAQEPIMDLLFNTIPNTFLKKEISVMSLYNIEDQYKEQDKKFFSSVIPKGKEFESDITLEKIDSKEAKIIRESEGSAPEINTIYYMPEYDRRPYNLIGQSVFLQGKYMKVKVKDLFDMSAINDVANVDDFIEMEHSEYEEAGYVAYYTPYFSFIDSLTHTVNAYAEGTNSGYKTLHYQKGVTKSTGRTADYFRSMFFLAPEMLEQYMTESIDEYEDTLNKLEVMENSGDDEQNTDTQDQGTTTNELLDEYTEGTTIEERTAKYNEDLFEAANYMRDELGGFEDWLGIKNRILFMEPDNDFDEETREIIKGNKWFPQEAELYEEDPFMKEYVDEKIVTINENTRNFIVTYLEPVATRVSDENLIKIVALYASMEFDKQFSTFGNQIYPKHINSIGMPNDTVTKFQYFNSYLNFNNITSKISYVIAKEHDWGGLLIALMDRIATLCKIILKITLMSLIPLTPFIIAFLYTTRVGRRYKILDKTINTLLVLLGVYYLDMISVKTSIWMVNKFGGMIGILVNFITSIIILIISYKLIQVVWRESNHSFLASMHNSITNTITRAKDKTHSIIYGTPRNQAVFNSGGNMTHSNIYNKSIYSRPPTDQDTKYQRVYQSPSSMTSEDFRRRVNEEYSRPPTDQDTEYQSPSSMTSEDFRRRVNEEYSRPPTDQDTKYQSPSSMTIEDLEGE